MRGSRRSLVGGVLILVGVVLMAGSWALHASGSTAPVTSSGSAPPLSTIERLSLQHDRNAVAQLPDALRQVTLAMADAAGSGASTPLSTTKAGELLFEHPELTQLLKAVERPEATAQPLAQGLATPTRASAGVGLLPTLPLVFFFVLPGALAVGLGLTLRRRADTTPTGRLVPALCLTAALVVLVGVAAPVDGGTAPWHALSGAGASGQGTESVGAVQNDLATLEQVYDDIVPALQIAGAAGRQVLTPQAAVATLAQSPRLADLNRFVTNFDQLYGAGILISQESAANASSPVTPGAMRWLEVTAIVTALLLFGAGLDLRRRRPPRQDRATQPTGPTLVNSEGSATQGAVLVPSTP
jgi:hypothetical protein